MLKFDSAFRHVRVKSKILTRRYNHSYESKLIDVKQLCSKSTQQEIADALRPYFEKQYPLLLKWPNIDSDAVRCWKSLDYLRMKVGEDAPCTVEIGGSYTNPDMERPEITFGDYILYMKLFHEQYGEEGSRRRSENGPDAKNLVYLAQNDLFSPLHLDFDVPELCQDPTFQVGNGRIYSTMFWFGPRGCVSPLHYDPLDNLLMQFVGRKNVVLFPPMRSKDTPPDVDVVDDDVDWHYAGHDGQQYNTSPVDIFNPDVEKYPLFKKAPMAIECQIEPGDILYIPSKWWHHVTSLDTTISVNVWWR